MDRAPSCVQLNQHFLYSKRSFCTVYLVPYIELNQKCKFEENWNCLLNLIFFNSSVKAWKKQQNKAWSSFIGFTHFIKNSVLRCSFIKVDVSLPSPGSILRTVTHFLFAKIQMKLVRKNTGDQENTVMT